MGHRSLCLLSCHSARQVQRHANPPQQARQSANIHPQGACPFTTPRSQQATHQSTEALVSRPLLRPVLRPVHRPVPRNPTPEQPTAPAAPAVVADIALENWCTTAHRQPEKAAFLSTPVHEDLQELEQLLRQQPHPSAEQVDAVLGGCAALLTRSGKLATRNCGQATRALLAFTNCVQASPALRALLPLHDVSRNSVAKTVAALGRSGVYADPQGIVQFALAQGTLQAPCLRFWNTLSPEHLAPMGPRELVSTMRGLAMIERPMARSATQAVYAAACAQAPKMAALDVVHALSALAKLHHPQQNVVKRGQLGPLIEAMRRHLPELSPQGVANTVWALATLTAKLDGELRSAIVAAAGARATELRPQELSALLWAFATLQFELSEAEAAPLLAAVRTGVPSMGAQSLSSTVWAVSVLFKSVRAAAIYVCFDSDLIVTVQSMCL